MSQLTTLALDRAVERLSILIGQLSGATPVSPEELRSAVDEALAESRSLRDTVLTASRELGMPERSWTDRDSLVAEVAELNRLKRERDLQQPRRRLTELAAELRSRRFDHRSARRRSEGEKLRIRAIEQVESAASADPPTLPGPAEVTGWIDWAWGLRDDELDELLSDLQQTLSCLAELVGGYDKPVVHVADPGEAQGTDAPCKPAKADSQPATRSGDAERRTDGAPGKPLDARAGGLSGPDRPAARGASKPVATATKPRRNTLVLTTGTSLPPRAAGPSSPQAADPQLPRLRQDVFGRDAPEDAATPAAVPPIGVAAGGRSDADAASPTDARSTETGDVEPISSTPIKPTEEANDERPRPGTSPTEAPSAPHADRTSGAGPEPESTSPLDDHLDFDRFADTWWISPSGACEPAPWGLPDFSARLVSRQEEALRDEDLALLWICGRAAEESRVPPAVSSDVAEAAWSILHAPTTGAMVTGSWWTSISREDGEHFRSERPTRILVAALAVLRPAEDQLPTKQEINRVIPSLELRCAEFAAALESLLRLQSIGADPARWIRTCGKSPGKGAPSPEELRADLIRRRRELWEQVKQNWSAAGGRIDTLHCRKAWSKFMQGEQATLRALYPPEHGGTPDNDRKPAVSELLRHRSAVLTMCERHESIAEAATARFRDRVRMDRAAADLQEACLLIIGLAERLRDAARPAPPAVPQVEGLDKTRQFLEAGAPPEDPAERLAVRILRAQFDARVKAEVPPSIGLRDLRARPTLLRVLPNLGWTDLESWGGNETESAPLGSVRPVREAAAILLTPPADIGSEPRARWPATIRAELEQIGQQEVLVQSDAAASGSRARPTAAWVGDQFDVMREGIDRLRISWRLLDAAGLPEADRARGALDQAERRLGAEGSGSMALFAGWLAHVNEAVGERVEGVRRRLRTSATTLEPDRAKPVLEAIDSGRTLDALRLLRGEAFPAPDLGRIRATEWRDRFRAAEQDPTHGPHAELLQSWRDGISGRPRAADRSLRADVAEFVFARLLADSKLPRKGRGEFSKPTEYRIPASLLWEHLSSRPMPTFTPQLRRFTDIVVRTPDVGVDSQRLSAKVAEAAGGSDDLVILPLPGLTRTRRTDLLQEVRRRRLRVVILDDIDFARLLESNDAPLGLAEVVLEQLPWGEMSPFSTSDGQYIHREMFVGRRTEAERLFKDAAYSRVFSGRKLGKSALLRFVQKEYDVKPLPSGLKLRVVYVPAVGAGSEPDIVDRIVESLVERPAATPRPTDPGPPGDRLKRLLDGYLEAHPEESLLVVLDEADRFVEAQIEEYDRVREKCLSFQMRSAIGQMTDSSGLPRIRFVFSGYRVTNTSSGAWANWGEILRLEPLAPAEAALLLAGPLARMGIDASDVALGVAWRCGYQPAILLKFGQELLQHIVHTRPPLDGRTVVVTAEDVATVANSVAVRQEIRLVVYNNFQGHPESRLVFLALLSALAEAPPLGGLADAEDRVVHLLREAVGDFGWLPAGTGSPEGFVAQRFRELRDRQLIRETRGADGARSLQLRFPHHLPVLVEDGLRDDMQKIAKELRGGRRDVAGVRSLMSGEDLSALREALDQRTTSDELAGAIVCSTWRNAVDHRSGGVADRLGLEPRQVLGRGAPHRDFDVAGRIAVIDADGATVDRVWSARRRDQPPPLFTGGAGLYRWTATHSARQYEVRGLGRVDAAGLGWWFGRIRGLEFVSNDALERVFAATSGIPLLVDAFDAALVRSGAIDAGTVSVEQFRSAERSYRESMPDAASQLLEGPQRLTRREREAILLVAHYSRESERPTPIGEFLALDETVVEGCRIRGLRIEDPDDGHAVHLLLDLGYLPRTRPGFPAWEHMDSLSPGDALLALAAHVQADP